jgi:hypothetical protein
MKIVWLLLEEIRALWTLGLESNSEPLECEV